MQMIKKKWNLAQIAASHVLCTRVIPLISEAADTTSSCAAPASLHPENDYISCWDECEQVGIFVRCASKINESNVWEELGLAVAPTEHRGKSFISS